MSRQACTLAVASIANCAEKEREKSTIGHKRKDSIVIASAGKLWPQTDVATQDLL